MTNDLFILSSQLSLILASPLADFERFGVACFCRGRDDFGSTKAMREAYAESEANGNRVHCGLLACPAGRELDVGVLLKADKTTLKYVNDDGLISLKGDFILSFFCSCAESRCCRRFRCSSAPKARKCSRPDGERKRMK